MAVVFGIDEAGYGPRFGPLVVAASGWDINEDPRTFDFWGRLQRVISRQRDKRGPLRRLHVADSKQVYSPAQGLENLERSVLTFLAVAGHRPHSFAELWQIVGNSVAPDICREPCFSEADLAFALPLSATQSEIDAGALDVAEEFAKQGVRLDSIQIDIVGVERFNSLTRYHGSKGSTLTQVSLDLISRCWKPRCRESTLVLADRHGGRRFYRGSLVEALEGRLVTCLCEQARCSHYRVDQSEFRFVTGGERHFPVAVASMIAKYVRELTMEAFNSFWSRHVPGVKATRGYPADAKRFRRDIAHAQERLGIADGSLWRIR